MNPIYQTIVLERKIPIPLYYQLKQFMIEYINNDTLKEGEMVPPEEELCILLNVSRPTIRQAFSELAAEGYLDRIKAKGTFITKPKISGDFFQKIVSFNEEFQKKGMVPATKVLAQSKISPYSEVLSKLNLKKNDKAIYLERLRLADDKQIVYVKTFLPYTRFKNLLTNNLEDLSLYSVLNDQYHVSAKKVTRNISTTLPDERIAEILDVEMQTPLLFVATLAYDENLIPFEYSLAYYRSDRYSLQIDLYKDIP